MLIDLTHMEFEILSDSRKPNFRTKKWEFKYFDDHPVPENIPYRIWVMKDKVEIYIRMRRSPPEFGFGFLLPSQVDAEVYADILLKTHPINNASLRNQYMLMAGGYDIRETYLRPHKVIVTNKMREKGLIGRYFAKFIFDGNIMEISKEFGSMKTPYYEKVSITWKLNGTKEQILESNTESLKMAERTVEGMRYFLDPFEFYEGEELTHLEKIQEKLSNLKFPPEPSTGGSGGGTGY